jgi:hypothetical protein
MQIFIVSALDTEDSFLEEVPWAMCPQYSGVARLPGGKNLNETCRWEVGVLVSFMEVKL